MRGHQQEDTLIGALGIASTLGNLGRYGEIKSFLPKNISAARSSLGVENSTTLQLTNAYARALADGGASLHDLREAVTTFEDIKETSNRVLGMDHPLSCEIQGNLERARKKGRHPGRKPKLSDDQRREIRDVVRSGKRTEAEAARLFGVHRSTISRVMREASDAAA